jgi:transmembrane sensor
MNSLEQKEVLMARAEASAWITRLHGPNRSAEMEEGLRRWLAERPENAQEFEGLTEVWNLVAGGAPSRGVPRLARWEHSAEAQELKDLRESSGSRTRRIKFWAVAAAVLLVVGSFAAYRVWPVSSYATALGEQRILQLADGSVVSLNSNSSVSIEFDQVARHVRLQRGEALFQVAKDAKRPFTVAAGESRVTALGTSFLVRLEGDRTAITLVDGKVAVLPSTGAASDVRILSPGQRLTLVAAKPPKLDTPPLDTVTAWRRGEVVLADTPLAEAVAEMNRYDSTQIVISSPEIESLKVSGLYHTGDSEGFAQSVVRMYGLELVEKEGTVRLQERKSP